MPVNLEALLFVAIFACVGLAVGFWGAKATQPPPIRRDLPARYIPRASDA